MGGLEQSLGELARHGYILLFAWIAAEQLGAPLPAVPILIAAGVISASGQLAFGTALLVGVLGCLMGDSVWYAIGKGSGSAVLRLLCKISLNPETCVRRSSEFISRYGSVSLLLAKFIPGVSSVAVPLAANSEISPFSFFAFDLLGSVFYIAAYLAAGRIIGSRIYRLAGFVNSIKSASILLAIFAALALVAWRFYQRRRFHADAKIPRITPEALRQLLNGQQSPFIIDLRHPLDMLTDPRIIPGAVRMTPDELSARQTEIPRDREIILYCT